MNKKKIGILGGGQLGKMLCLVAANWDLDIYVLDAAGCSAQSYCPHFVEGSFRDFNDVLNFGRLVDIVTIEIEHVNTDALRILKQEGKTIHPDPDVLDLIKDKGKQKIFYKKHGLPTDFIAIGLSLSDIEDMLETGVLTYPFVWKSTTGGYDGKGVSLIFNQNDKDKIPDVPYLIEPLTDIDKELAVIVARNERGDVIAYPSVEMAFDPKANLLDFQISPAAISKKIEKKAQELAKTLIKKLNICGLLAVEMFLTKDGRLLINEVAPRPHNSGHHTIEAHETSQYEQYLRAILNMPLGSTTMRSPSVLLNLLGAQGYVGDAHYQGFEKALSTEGVHIHLYGKKTTHPFRKMGHVTVLNKNIERAKAVAMMVKKELNVICIQN
jgi:5-(carboxyamino)imidazole ribonucleotide synthase